LSFQQPACYISTHLFQMLTEASVFLEFPCCGRVFFFFFCVLPVPRRKCVCDRFRFPTV
jgi:hypothetical protein